jgi:Trk-type K+ transport system membrane component
MDNQHSKLPSSLTRLRYRFHRGHKRVRPFLATITRIVDIGAFIAAIACIVGLIVFLGFEHSKNDVQHLSALIRGSQLMFIINVAFNIVFNYRTYTRDNRLLKWIVDIAILLTLPPMLYPEPSNPWIPWLADVLYNKAFIFSIVGIYAIVAFCFGIIKVIGKRVNPSLILAFSFLFFIAIGSLLLMMPRCTVTPINYTDSLFVSTSAVCITGLTPIDIASTFTPFGILILSLLIQIGGLGVMTFTSFFALFFSGNTSIYSQLMVKDMIYSKTINSLLPTLLYILGFSLVIELLGAIGIFVCIHGTLGMSLEDELIFSGFHSLSAFCNAGFSNIADGMANPALLHSNQMIYIVASALIFAGGIGFPILVNFKTALLRYIRRVWRYITNRPKNEPAHLYDMNTKIVMITTITIFIVSALLFFIFEYNNSLAGMSLYEKIVQSIFNAFVPRSSGFASLNPAGFMNITIIMMIALMWIGGGSQSTAGGVKVNTFAVVLLELRAVVTGKRRVTVFNRTLATDSIRRASTVVTISILAYILYSMALVLLEPTLPVKSLLYESASAIFTVGSSLGITDQLGDGAKILLCSAMFLGRVGIISLLTGFAGQRNDPPVKYPVDNVIIN